MNGGFLIGANLPWMRYGGDFGANAWHPTGGLATPGGARAAREALCALADSGVEVVRWFLLCDGRAGISFDSSGEVVGPDDRVLADLDAALELLAAARLRAIFVLVDFLWFLRPRIVNGVQLGGRGHLIADARRRPRLLERVFAPILERVGHEAAIRAWDLLNEPDWIVTRFTWLRRRGIQPAALREYLRGAASLVHALTSHAVTVGTARPSMLPLVSGLGLDFYQVHWYDKLRCRFDLGTPPATFGADGPVMLGEFATRDSRVPPAAILRTAQASGYAGALGWSACAADRYSSAVALRTAIERHLHQC